MATLTAGELSRMYALGGVARGGAFRGGYVDGRVYLSHGGQQIGWGPSDPTIGTIIDSLTIHDVLDEQPNSCQYRVNGTVPATGVEVIITLGSKNRLERLFGGYALTVHQIYAADNPRNVQGEVSAVDYTWYLGFQKVTKQYRAMSATAIAKDLIASYAAVNGFSSHGIAANLPVLDVITFTNEDLPEALTRLARRIGGYWFVDYLKDVHLFFADERNGAPEVLTLGHRSLAQFTREKDRTQLLTRVYVEGRGSRLLGMVGVGETMIPIEASEMFTAASDVFAKLSFQGSEGGAQHINFSGVVLGGSGSLVGPGAGPPGAPSVSPTIGSGLSTGTYQYAYTDVTASGETLPSPVATVSLIAGAIPAPTVAPTQQLTISTAGVTYGGHAWGYTYVTAGGGETTISPAGPYQNTAIAIQATGGLWGSQVTADGVLPLGYYHYRWTYVGTAGGESVGTDQIASINCYWDGFWNINLPELFFGDGNLDRPSAKIPPGVTQLKLYRSPVSSDSFAYRNGPYYYVATITLYSPDTNPTGNFVDRVTTTGAAIPSTGTAWAQANKVHLILSASPVTGVSGYKIYRSKAGTSTPFFLVAETGFLQYDDTIPDANLGPQAPSENTAGNEYRAVYVFDIAAGPPGPPGTIARKLYRTAANGAQLKLAITLNDNTTTAVTDTVADASLGANAPTGDTSGLLVPAGQVTAGSTSMLVANVAIFESAGWIVIGNGEQVIRYTGKGTGSLTGIPQTGIGAIVAGIAYNSTVTQAPMLTGIPTSGARSIQFQLVAGDEVYLVVQRDDTARQSQLAAAVGGNGIREEWIQDRRLSIPEARARGDATLKQRPLDAERVRYTSRDLRTAAGKTVTVDLGAPTNVNGTYKIQSVTITNFRPRPNQYPTFTVEASSERFSFEDLLRLTKLNE